MILIALICTCMTVTGEPLHLELYCFLLVATTHDVLMLWKTRNYKLLSMSCPWKGLDQMEVVDRLEDLFV